MWQQWFGGVWQENTPLIFFATDPGRLHAVYPEYVMPDAQWKAFADTRTGMVVGRNLANQYGWKIGEKVPIALQHLSAEGWQQGLDLRPGRHL